MTFYGIGGVWDKENDKILCRFVDGEFQTEDKRVIKILTELGYKSDSVAPNVSEAPKKVVRKRSAKK